MPSAIVNNAYGNDQMACQLMLVMHNVEVTRAAAAVQR